MSTSSSIGIVTPLLGHGSLATAQRHYNRAKAATAAARWHDVFEEIRKG